MSVEGWRAEGERREWWREWGRGERERGRTDVAQSVENKSKQKVQRGLGRGREEGGRRGAVCAGKTRRGHRRESKESGKRGRKVRREVPAVYMRR